MPEQDKSSKTEQPTSKRLRDTRQKGQVARSLEFTSALVFLCTILFFNFYLPLLLTDTIDIVKHLLIHSDSSLVVKDYFDTYFQFSITAYIKTLMPFFAFALLLSLFVNYVQGGFIFSTTPLEFKFSKLNPVTGFYKILLSKRTLVELFKNVIKIFIVSFVGYKVIKDFIPDMILLVDQTPWQIILYFGKAAYSLCFKISALLLVMAILDYMYQRYEFKSNLKMTKTEVKDELKEQEGNPKIKSKRMGMMIEVFRRRMMTEVPKADVVITNPTTLAVAVRYDMENAPAPVVVAKGARLVAEKIKEIAKDHGVPIIENKLLARLLFTSVEIGHQIPEQFYKAVAEILAYIYKLKNKKVV